MRGQRNAGDGKQSDRKRWLQSKGVIPGGHIRVKIRSIYYNVNYASSAGRGVKWSCVLGAVPRVEGLMRLGTGLIGRFFRNSRGAGVRIVRIAKTKALTAGRSHPRK